MNPQSKQGTFPSGGHKNREKRRSSNLKPNPNDVRTTSEERYQKEKKKGGGLGET